MSLFKERRVKLLALAVLISVMLVWRPWGGLEPRARGLNFGVDIAGGYRAVLWLDVSHVTIRTSTDNLDSAWNSIRSALEDNLNTTVNLVARYPAENRIVVEVGKSVTSAFVQEIIGGSGTVVDVQNSATPSTLDDAISKLHARIDPYGLLETRFWTLGENYILFETAQLDYYTKELVTKQGRLELFIENELVLTDKNIEIFGTPVSAGRVYSSIPIRYTEEGEQKLKTASKGKTGLAGAVYLDRPSDAILIFDERVLNELSKLTYDNATRMFTYTTTEYTGEELQYTLRVPAIGTSVENLSPEALEYLESPDGVKLRALLLGSTDDFARIIENVPARYRVESIPQLSGESKDKWIKRACGVISDLPVYLGVGSGRIVVEVSLQEARNLRTILSNKSPTELSLRSEAEIGSRLGAGFMREALIAGAVAVAGVFLLIYYRYRRWKICLVFIGFTLCELLITFGGASVLGLTLGLPEIGGLLVVIGTGIDHQLTTTDEVLRGVHPEKAGAGWRASRTLPMIYASIFMTLAAVVPIAVLGFGALRGFAAIAITGTVLAFLFTRPTYPKAIDAILTSSRASAT
ncbi:MAG: hypothetical protein QMD00_01535 [Hadesarchaea archaeon]|nr:hypothetical protein [Hadesarchaea archaeon]